MTRGRSMKLKFLTALLACTMATPALADVLIDNVEGLTIDEDGDVQRFTGIVIGDDGKIVQLLERGDDKPQTDYREDGQGQRRENRTEAPPRAVRHHQAIRMPGAGTAGEGAPAAEMSCIHSPQ